MITGLRQKNGHVQKQTPNLYHAQLYEEITDTDILTEYILILQTKKINMYGSAVFAKL